MSTTQSREIDKIAARLKVIYSEATVETIAEKKNEVKSRRRKIKEQDYEQKRI